MSETLRRRNGKIIIMRSRSASSSSASCSMKRLSACLIWIHLFARFYAVLNIAEKKKFKLIQNDNIESRIKMYVKGIVAESVDEFLQFSQTALERQVVERNIEWNNKRCETCKRVKFMATVRLPESLALNLWVQNSLRTFDKQNEIDMRSR